MSIISIQNLSFGYDGIPENVFDQLNADFDSAWKLGLVGRNGRGKTTLLALLSGLYPYRGNIVTSVRFSRYPEPVTETDPALSVTRSLIAPFDAWENQMEALLNDGSCAALEEYGEIATLYSDLNGYIIDELIVKEMNKLGVAAKLLARPWYTLSGGERCKLMLAGLFLRQNHFLLIDEPTNHLDFAGRATVAEYLAAKQGFLLISHDRWFLDQTVDHIMALEKTGIVIQTGNYSSYAKNKADQDAYELARNEQLKRAITGLEKSAREKAAWSDKIEASKIGEHAADRGYIGHQAAKMMKRSKSIEKRQNQALEEKKALLKNLESAPMLTLNPLSHHQNPLVSFQGVGFCYQDSWVLKGVTLQIKAGERIGVTGVNGSGKSTLLQLAAGKLFPAEGELRRPQNLIISYLNQETSWLKGDLRGYIQKENLPETQLKTILRKLDFSRLDFTKPMELYSQGMKKKVLLAASLCSPAHLYIWDEPLNYIDVASRQQIEDLILAAQPTLLFVEHDRHFQETVATQTFTLPG